MSIEAIPEVLVVQARVDSERIKKEQENLEVFAEETGRTFRFVSPFFPSEIDWDNPEKIAKQFEALLFMGTSDIDFSFKDIMTMEGKRREIYLNKVIPLIQKAYEMEKFIHGICFGHQAMAIAAGGENIVQQVPEQKEYGTVSLTLTLHGEKDALFAGLPSTVKIVAIHKDSVVALPPDFSILGSTERNVYSALRMGNATSTQTHPEITDITGLATRIEKSKESALGRYVVTHKLAPPDDAGRVIVNFLNQIKSQGDIFVSYPSPKAA